MKLIQFLVPAVQRLLRVLPERPSRFAVASFLLARPASWGLDRRCERVRCTRKAFEVAFPDRDPDDEITRWRRRRAQALATSLVYMARMDVGRTSRLIRKGPAFTGPSSAKARVISLLHYSIEPALQLALIEMDPQRNYRWPSFPVQEGDGPAWREERELWLAGTEVPEKIRRMMLPVTDASWLLEAFRHVRGGGDVFVAIDVAFEARRPAAHRLEIGRAKMPVAPAVELLAQIEGVDLMFAYPLLGPGGSWTLELERLDNVKELAERASEWIAENPHHWSGWPYLGCRQDPAEMRRLVRTTSLA